MTVRVLVLAAHRWLGIATSAVLFVAGLTGVVLVWPALSAFKPVANRLHTRLALGPAGHLVVIGSTVAAIVILVAGVFLWWKRRIVTVRAHAGWRSAMFDIHHLAGIVALPVMLLLAVSGLAMLGPAPVGGVKRMLVRLHTARDYSDVIRVLYTLGTIAFAVQALSGLVMWWKTQRRDRSY